MNGECISQGRISAVTNNPHTSGTEYKESLSCSYHKSKAGQWERAVLLHAVTQGPRLLPSHGSAPLWVPLGLLHPEKMWGKREH